MQHLSKYPSFDMHQEDHPHLGEDQRVPHSFSSLTSISFLLLLCPFFHSSQSRVVIVSNSLLDERIFFAARMRIKGLIVM